MDNTSPCHGEETGLSPVQSAKLISCGEMASRLPVKEVLLVRVQPREPSIRVWESTAVSARLGRGRSKVQILLL